MTDPPQDHYSYSVYADPSMAERFHAMRFGGPIGRLIADTQEHVIATFLDPLDGRRVLDVGTGTGRAAIALARRGAAVTGVDASAEMLAVARREADQAGVTVSFAREDAHHLSFPDRSFEATVCLRVLMHTPDWKRSLAELCRVSMDRVVFDYPALVSAAALQSIARRVVQVMGVRVEAYRVFSDTAIRKVLRRNGFRIAGIHRQFVLPIAVHKRMNSEAATRRIEDTLARMGCRSLVGSPVTVVAQRCGS